MSRFTFLIVASCLTTSALAHHPDRECQPVYPRVDVIGPLGNCLPESYRRKYNRPTYLGGKIAYKIAPTSQEAMAWHRAEHHGAYDNPHGRCVSQYFYPKPWEALRVGARASKNAEQDDESPRPALGDRQDDSGEIDADLVDGEDLEAAEDDVELVPAMDSASDAQAELPNTEFKDFLKQVDPLELGDGPQLP
ncbi:hypothetical protein [Novipirellula artificiosorum]|uniref:Uncharacterized protein n=1 Tax=Novipirellula artificiosorum TaxID=2528016 RepID=A0A5C6E359_9BACT|nr:hypothetical protein [Novipirellula artificiosorum]TWU41826.1 hypothetical protein Poly41_01180 [Novipirellula artificiosorum]